MTLLAPAKLNLCLYVGPAREDGRHELRSLFVPLSLADRVTVADAELDGVVCPGVEGPNLASIALRALRARGWSRSPVRFEIDKRIPVAAGLGGGSADAAAVLRMAEGEIPNLDRIASALGADVPSQLSPSFALVAGAGEQVTRLPPPGESAFVLIPPEHGLSTARVYEEADRIGTPRGREELAGLEGRLREAAGGGETPLEYTDLLVNDLQPAALSLRPEIGEALAALEEVGAARALVTGSGPTAFGLFESLERAEEAAAELPPRYATAIVAEPVRTG